MANIDKSVYSVVIDRDNGNARTGDLTISFSGNIDLDKYTLYSSVPEITFTPVLINTQTATIAIEVNHANLGKGFYQAQCNAVSWFETIPFTINLSILSENEIPIIDLPPALKYFIKYGEYRLEIEEKGFIGTPTQIYGDVTHGYADRSDLFMPIVASYLSIDVEANVNLTLSDLYSENEGQFIATLFKGAQTLFKGHLKPDGIEEDWVNPYWMLKIDAMDGLSTLKDLEFPKLATELTQFEAVKIALSRLGYELPINVHNMLPQYVGLTTGESSLNSVYIDSERFYQTDSGKSQLMDCEEVISSVLNIYNATLIQMHGEWWIFRSNDVSEAMTFKRYVSGAYVEDIAWNAGKALGSHIDAFAIIHANSNQRKSIAPSTQALRVNYKYGLVGSIYVNPYINTTTGLSSEGWTIQSMAGRIERQSDGSGLQIVGDINSQTPELIMQNSQPIPVLKDDALRLRFNHSRQSVTNDLTIFHFHIETPNFRLGPEGWIAKPVGNNIYIDTVAERMALDATHDIEIRRIPEDGNLTIKVLGWHVITYGGLNDVYINELSITPADTGVKGEFHKVERKGRVSTKTADDMEVHNGDSESSLYLGTLRRSDHEPTTLWNRVGKTDGKPILQIMAEDRLRIAPRPMIHFTGDVYGYYPYLSRFTINNITGQFQVSSYNFNTATGINRSALREYSTDYLNDTNYDFKYDYGDETKVVIRS